MKQYLHVQRLNYFQRKLCSRTKTDTYYYHKRKWNKKVNSNSKTGTQQLVTILTDEHVALVHSVCSGSTLIIMTVQSFEVLLILCISGGSLGTTTSPQQQNTANLKDLCEVWNNLSVFAYIFGSLFGQRVKKHCLKKVCYEVYIGTIVKPPVS